MQGIREPLATDRVVVPDEPIAIKAGDLIGHLGQYHCGLAEQPEKLHLEMFSDDDVEAFLESSRTWAKELPDKEMTWLKLTKGTAVVPHQAHYSAKQPPSISPSSPQSDADLLLPKSLLDDLPADQKISVPATPGREAHCWYRLEGLFHGADKHPLDGWVREDVGITPWVSPWSWDGYDVVHDYTPPRTLLASFLRGINSLTDARFPLADSGDNCAIKNRLHALIDPQRDGAMSAEKIQAAIQLPAHAQSISQLIVQIESEWFDKPRKWDALDEMLGHSGSTPHLNWLAEKTRIKALSWWGEVAAKVGLPVDGKVYHFHPIGLSGRFGSKVINIITYRIYHNGLIEKVVPGNATEAQLRDARYLYTDNTGREFDFGIFKGTQATRWTKKDIKGTETIYLMDASDLGRNPERQFGFRFVTGTSRTYLSQSALASFIGVLMELNYQDVASTGFSDSDGSPGASKSHINGENGDFRFLRTDHDWSQGTDLSLPDGVAALDEARQTNMSEALYKFGWKQQLAWTYLKDKKPKTLPRTIHFENHHHHLHVGKYAPAIKEIKK